MRRILGIEFTPLSVPLGERLRALLMFFWVFSFLFLGPTCTVFTIWLAFTSIKELSTLLALLFLLSASVSYISAGINKQRLRIRLPLLIHTRVYDSAFHPGVWPLVLLYSIWYLYDIQTSNRGGRRSEWCRRWKVWEYFRDYFPLKLVKTSELSPDRNYMFGCHPHGVFSISHFCNFATEATGFSRLFPGITPHLAVLDGNFRYPLYREIFMGPGFCGCNKNSIEYILSAKRSGNASCVVVGGASELMEAHPGQFTLKLINRKGFIKLAIRAGADLIPVFSFGENDVYQQVSNPLGSKLRAWQDFLGKLFLPPPLIYGRGIFTYNFGFLPYRKPITTVVGKPIEVTKNPFPTNQEINDLHARYMASLEVLFESHKHKYGISEIIHLEFV